MGKSAHGDRSHPPKCDGTAASFPNWKTKVETRAMKSDDYLEMLTKVKPKDIPEEGKAKKKMFKREKKALKRKIGRAHV